MKSTIFAAIFLVLLTAACTPGDDQAIRTTDIGNRYSYLVRNEEGTLPSTGDYVYFNLELRNQRDSSLMDSRQGGKPLIAEVRPDTLSEEEISPVDDVLRELREGETALIRYNIADLPSRPPELAEDSVIVYEIEIEEVLPPEEFFARRQAEQTELEAERDVVRALEPERVAFAQNVYERYSAGELEGELQSTDNGLRYIIHEEGDGEEADPGDQVTVQYIGMLTSNGEIFDQSFARGEGIPFQLGSGQVIPGWDQGIDLLQVGDKATFFIPAELGYGDRGAGAAIPPGSELMFYVELEEVN
jgi:FKBP-type peptidyl-prolyl cis-trans isomerase FkpA